MGRGGSKLILWVIIAGVILFSGGVLVYEAHKSNPSQVVIMQNTTTTPVMAPAIIPTTSVSATAASSSAICATDLSDFAVPPLPPVGSEWIQSTSSAGKLANPDAFDIWPRPSSSSGALGGTEWFANGNGLRGWDRGYYYPILTQQGWSKEIGVDGYTIYGITADGYHDSIDGYVKIADGYLRSVTINNYTSGSAVLNKFIVFASDIVPLSQVIPSYQPSCPATSSSPQFQNRPYIQLMANLPGVLVTDPSGKRVGRDEIASATYSEIPDSSYSVFSITTKMLIPNPTTGKYTITLSAKSLWYTGYGLTAWIGDDQSPVPYVLDLSGNINNGQMITYALDYNQSNAASSTLIIEATSTPSATSTPILTTTTFSNSSSR